MSVVRNFGSVSSCSILYWQLLSAEKNAAVISQSAGAGSQQMSGNRCGQRAGRSVMCRSVLTKDMILF